MRLRQATAIAVVVAASLAPLSACSDDTAPSAGSKATPAAGASSSSVASSGSSSQPVGHLDKNGMVRALTVGQVKGGSAHLAMTMSGAAAITAQGDVDYSGGSPKMQLTMAMASAAAGKIQLRLVDGLLYLHIPQATPAGKFLKIDPSNPRDPMSGAFGSLSSQLDPLSSFRAMRTAVRTVRFVGTDTVGGDRTDHYTVAVDSATLFKAMKQKSVPQMPATLTYDIWLDGSDLLRRMRTDTLGQRTQLTLSDWGKKVTVRKPPRSAIVTGGAAG
jgi:hypothetical protein